MNLQSDIGIIETDFPAVFVGYLFPENTRKRAVIDKVSEGSIVNDSKQSTHYRSTLEANQFQLFESFDCWNNLANLPFPSSVSMFVNEPLCTESTHNKTASR